MANKEYIERLQMVINHLHKCSSIHLETVPVKETFRGQTVWEGDVEVFSISGNPKANRCYGWGAKIGTPEEYFKAVIETPPVKDARTAVQVSIVADQKNHRS